MSERHLVGAYTAPGTQYPAFISVNQVGRVVTITARGPINEGHCGACVDVTMDADVFEALLHDMEMRIRT